MPAEDTNSPERSGDAGTREEARPSRASATSAAPDAPAVPDASDVSGKAGTPKASKTSKPSKTSESSEPSKPSAGAGEPDGLTVRDPVSAPDAKGRPRRVTRRFPLFTRDTARPEGGGRAAARDAPAPARQWPVLAVVLLVGLGLLLTALDVFRWGTLLVGAALLAGAALRWVVPDVGMLAVRSRFTDITTYGVLGLSIVLLALMAQPKPVLEIPFLKDTLHFTVS
ncbi:DUF3017 domain-containing protein [Streptomyces ardesiacus]|uniref:DUF3017 domain-containing protein n=1 Tax=Streptomyces ardesiacus TaxID=285564 RepID=UPI00201E8C90|nr:DUF3017 domain-containing protein [Streptomyces ardesiacus]MCL7368071.1 DUF3017 domain-containing protein [Streptomyces ardesiacus]